MQDLFLSHNSADKPAVEALALRLRASGIEPWLDKWNLIPGNPWQKEIEQALNDCKACAVFIGPSGMGPWQDAEMRAAIDRRVSKGDFRVIPILLPGAKRDKRSSLPTFLTATTWVEFHDTLDDEDAFHRLLAGIRGVAPGATQDDSFNSNECPYRGLRVFDVEHAPLFFGRSALIEWLLEAIRPKAGQSNRFLGMLGASGSGKSSLARAGLLAQLQQGGLPDSQHWPQIILKPGAKPLESLAIAICNDPVLGKGQQPASLINDLEQHQRQLHLLCRQALHGEPDSRRVVVLVDQFEEVFTLCHDDIERTAFINNLLNASVDVTGKTIVILTLRADFYGKCASYPQLAAALSDDQFLISPMNETELREVIQEPALRSGCELEAGLVDVLLKDVKDQPGSLPLLEYTLTRLWEQRQSRVIRLADYQALGGLEGALNKRADEIYEGLSSEQKQICQHIFLRLVQPGEGTEDTRRRASLNEFGDDEAINQVVQKLVSFRLITTQKKAVDGESFAEVTHEALIRNWSQLKGWIEADRESLKLRTQLNQAANEWEKNEFDAAWLLTGTRLQLAEEWWQQDAPKLSVEESQFLEQSRKAHKQQLAAKAQRLAAEKAEQKKQAELLKEKAALEEKQRQMAEQQVRDQKKSLSRVRGFSLAMSILALLMIAAAWFAVQSSDEAKQYLRDANYNLKKVSEEKALHLLPDDRVLKGHMHKHPELLRRALLHTLDAADSKVPEGKQPLDSSFFGRLSLLRETDLVVQKKKTPALNLGLVDVVTVSPDGKSIASLPRSERTIKQWDIATGEVLTTMSGHTDFINAVAYSPDGKTIASGSSDDTIKIWDSNTGALLRTLQGHLGGVHSLVYSPNGRTITSGSTDKTVRSWDVASGKALKIFEGHTGRVTALAYHSNGNVIASGSVDKTVRLWDVKSGESLRVLEGHAGAVLSVIYSKDGKLISTARDNTVRSWDTSTGEGRVIFKDEESNIFSFSYNPDRHVFAVGVDVGKITILEAEKGNLITTLKGHSRIIKSVAFNSDGSLLVSASGDRTVRIWDTNTSQVVFPLRGHTDTIGAVAYSPDGSVVVTGGYDKKLMVWDAATGNLQSVLQGHNSAIRSVAFSRDGTRIVSGSSDRTIRLWNVKKRELLQTFRGHTEDILSVAFSVDGQTIASGSRDMTVRLWDVQGGVSSKVFNEHVGPVSSVAFNPDGSSLASASEDTEVKVWNVKTGVSDFTFKGHSKAVRSIAYSPDGKLLASASDDFTVQLWDMKSGTRVKKIKAHRAKVWSLVFSNDGRSIASSSEDKTVRIWNPYTGDLLNNLQGHSGPVLSAAYSPDSNTIVSGSEDKTLRFWDVNIDEASNVLQKHTSGVFSVAYSPNGQVIASGSHDDTAILYDGLSGGVLGELKGHDGWFRSLAFSPDSEILASASPDKTIMLWDVAEQKHLRTLKGHDNRIWAIAFSPTGQLIASGSHDHTVRIWDVEEGKLLHTLKEHNEKVYALAYSPDGALIASGAGDKTIKIWNAKTFEVIKTLKGHSEAIFSLAFSPDGKSIVSGSYDKTLRLWDVVSGKLNKTLRGHTERIRSVAFSPNGRTVASGSDDETVRLWDVQTGKTLKTLKAHNASVFSVAFRPDGNAITSVSPDKTMRIWKLDSPIHRLLYDFDPKEVATALNFVWEMGSDGDDVNIKSKPHAASLLSQDGYHINFADGEDKYRSLLDMPKSGETKLGQVVRFLETRCAYKLPEFHGCKAD